MIRAALVTLCLAAAGVAQAAPASVAIGDLVLDYDDTEWHVTARPEGAVLQWIACEGFGCEDRPGISVSIAPADGLPPPAIPRHDEGFARSLWELLDGPVSWIGEGEVREVNGFAIFAIDRWSGCRAMSPSQLTAILDHDGRRYTFTSGIVAACRGVWGVGREAFVEILTGLKPRG